MMTRPVAAALLAWSLIVSGFAAGAGADGDHHHEPVGNRRAGMTGVLSLDVYSEGGRLHLLAGRLDEARSRTLWYQRSSDGGNSWSRPVRVDWGMPAPQTFRRGNDAQIAATEQALMAVWTGKGTGWGGTGPLVIAVSRDGGKSWRRAANPADDGLTTSHAFVELFADVAGFKLAWIDKREKSVGLRYAWSGDAGASWSPNVTIDAPTCECCWNSIVNDGKETYLMYRGSAPRDMMLAASVNGAGWRRVGTVGAFNWDINACPETGGALAVMRPRSLHALVWTGKESSLGLYHLLSSDAGRTWSRPRRMGGPDARHADLASAPDGTLVAVWDDNQDQVIRAAISSDGGITWSSSRPLSDTSMRASHPRVIPVPGGFRVFWTEMPGAGGAAEWRSVQLTAR